MPARVLCGEVYLQGPKPARIRINHSSIVCMCRISCRTAPWLTLSKHFFPPLLSYKIITLKARVPGVLHFLPAQRTSETEMTSLLINHIGDFFREVLTWSTPKLLVVSALSGITSHIVFFIRGELDHIAREIFFGLLLTPAAILAIFFSLGIPFAQASATTATIWGSFLSGLTASIIAYRLFFHPLRKFPGPVMARTTKWWGALKTASGYQHHYAVQSMHQKYGEFVRIGKSPCYYVTAVPSY